MVAKKTAAKKVPAKRASQAKSPRTTTAAPAKKAAKTPAKKSPTKTASTRTGRPRRRDGRRPAPDARLLQVLELKRDGKSYAEIATKLKYSSADLAFRAFEQAMQMLEVTSIANDRLLQRERLNQLQGALWPDAKDGDPKALDLLLKIMDRQAAIPQPLDSRPDRQLGDVEAATKKETEKLARHAPALAAAVLVLARNVDDNASDPKAAEKAARELRISMAQLRGLAGTRVEPESGGAPQPRKGAKKSVVVPPSRLEQLRQQADSGTGPT